MPRVLLRALATALTVASISFGSPARAQGACGSSGYAYAGLGASHRAYGIATWLQASPAPQVLSGHVAGWVGVGGPGAGPNGTDEWLQVGFSGFPGSSTSSLYYEIAQPRQAPQYHEIAAGVPSASVHKVAVMELRNQRSWWSVVVDDRAVGVPVYLPGSHGAWRPLATTETWGAGSFVCNRFSYRFGSVSLATRPGGGWQRLRSHYTFQNHGYRIKSLGAANFLAGAV